MDCLETPYVWKGKTTKPPAKVGGYLVFGVYQWAVAAVATYGYALLRSILVSASSFTAAGRAGMFSFGMGRGPDALSRRFCRR